MIHPSDKLVIPDKTTTSMQSRPVSSNNTLTVDRYGRERDTHIFADIPSALRYGRTVFNYKTDREFYVEYENGHYAIYWDKI